MDSTAHISELIDQLDDDLASLQMALKTIINKSLADVAAGYPVLDRAKLFILVTYAIESAIFSFLRLTGTSAREHPVFRELERVKQYFQKAKLVETSIQKPAMRLDQAAAGRFVKAALAGNDAPKGTQKVAVEGKSIEEHPTATAKDENLPRKRKFEATPTDSPESPAAAPESEILDDESENDNDPRKDAAESSKPATLVQTPVRGHSESSPMQTVGSAEEAHKALSKSQRKKLRKAEKKKVSQGWTSVNESESIEPQQKKVKSDGDRKKEKKKKKRKSKDRKTAG